VYIGTIGWFAALCVLLVARYVFDAWPPIWLWTALAGTVLSMIGILIMWWQRTASRRGHRGAQRDL
jgi:H+/Cl- antiporter ClcA